MVEQEQSGMVRNAIVLGLVVAVAAIVFIVFGQMIAKTEAAAINAGGQADTYLKAGDTSYNITVPKGQTTFTLFLICQMISQVRSRIIVMAQ